LIGLSNMVLEWLHHGNWSVPNKSGKVELKDSQGSNYKDSVGSKLAIALTIGGVF
jgi:hypothetical protein